MRVGSTHTILDWNSRRCSCSLSSILCPETRSRPTIKQPSNITTAAALLRMPALLCTRLHQRAKQVCVITVRYRVQEMRKMKRKIL